MRASFEAVRSLGALRWPALPGRVLRRISTDRSRWASYSSARLESSAPPLAFARSRGRQSDSPQLLDMHGHRWLLGEDAELAAA